MRYSKDDIITYLKEIKPHFQDDIKELALFGSFAKNTQTPYSDIDIAISKQTDFLAQKSSYQYFEIIGELKESLSKKFHRNIDVFDLDSQSPFKETIKKELLYV